MIIISHSNKGVFWTVKHSVEIKLFIKICISCFDFLHGVDVVPLHLTYTFKHNFHACAATEVLATISIFWGPIKIIFDKSKTHFK